MVSVGGWTGQAGQDTHRCQSSGYVYEGGAKGEAELLFSFGWASRLNSSITEQHGPRYLFLVGVVSAAVLSKISLQVGGCDGMEPDQSPSGRLLVCGD